MTWNFVPNLGRYYELIKELLSFLLSSVVPTIRYKDCLLNAEYIEYKSDLCILFILHPLRSDSPTPIDDVFEKFYRSLYLTATEGLCRALPKGCFIEENQALARIFGYDNPKDLLMANADIMRSIYVEADRVNEGEFNHEVPFH